MRKFGWRIAVLMAVLLDLLAMIFADTIMKTPFIKYALQIMGAVMGVLQVSLAVQVIANASRELNALRIAATT